MKTALTGSVLTLSFIDGWKSVNSLMYYRHLKIKLMPKRISDKTNIISKDFKKDMIWWLVLIQFNFKHVSDLEDLTLQKMAFWG